MQSLYLVFAISTILLLNYLAGQYRSRVMPVLPGVLLGLALHHGKFGFTSAGRCMMEAWYSMQ